MEDRDVIIFDGDDTLWRTQALYDQAKDQFFDCLQGLGLDRRLAINTFTRIDVENMATWGFAKQRFPTSMQQAYVQLCQQYAVPINEAVLDKIYRIGYMVFDRKPRLMDNVRDMLHQLRKKYRLYLYTAGDSEVQRSRVEQSGLGQYFDAIYIRAHKNTSELRSVMDSQQLDAARTWVVGNSLKSDINPALQLGLQCIWLRGGSWEYDDDVLLPGQVQRVTKLSEIPTIVSRGAIDVYNGRARVVLAH